MAETTTAGRPAPSAHAPQPADRQPEERGRTVLAERVIQKIAAQIASEQPHIGGTSGGVLGLGRQESLDARPTVKVELTGRIATLALEVGVRSPAPIRQVTEDLRETLRRRVTEATGVQVRQVDIRVGYLQPRTEQGRRELL